MNRLLHLIDTGGPGGAETVMVQLVEGLDPSLWQSTVVVPSRDWLLSALANRGRKAHVVPSNGPFDYQWLFRVLRIARSERVNLIQAHLFGAGVYGSIVGRLLGLPVVVTMHGEVDLRQLDRFRRLKEAALRRRQTRVVGVTDSLARRIVRDLRVATDHVRVIHNGIDIESIADADGTAFRERFGWTHGEVLVGALGNVRAPKDYANLIEAAARVRQHRLDCRFVIVGDVDGEPSLTRDLIAVRDSLGLQHDLVFAGFDEDVSRALSSFDIFVSSSSQEGLPLALLQAMAARLPIVATRSGGPQEVITDGTDGLLVPIRDPGALASAISSLISDPGHAERMAQAARQKVEKEYSLSGMVKKYEDLYVESLSD